MWCEPIPFLSPLEAARRLRPLGRLALLDSAAPDPGSGLVSIAAADPFAEFTASLRETRFGAEHLSGCPFAALDEVLRRYALPPGEAAPGCGAIGGIDFEATHFTEDLPRPPDLDPERPLLALGFYDTVLRLDTANRTARLESAGFGEGLDARSPALAREERARRRIARFREALLLAPAEPHAPAAAPPPLLWRSSHDEASYARMVERVRELIRAGDLFQANVSREIAADLPAGFDPFGFYATLREVNPAPFAAFLERDGHAVASASPELFLRLRGRDVETRPIKGTRRRHADPALDAAAARELLASPKDRAENVMIVDLMRNDLSRVAEPASVAVPALCALQSVRGVHHLVSTVSARLVPGAGVGALLAATFPGGSITGAPKIRACEVIAELEGRARGIYCGSLAALGFDGSADLSIAIRTVEFGGGRVRFASGGGVTILSDGVEEYRETQTKVAAIEAAFARHAAAPGLGPGPADTSPAPAGAP